MNQEPSELLRIAREHIDLLPAQGSPLDIPNLSPLFDHALQAIILSAAAAESAVNLALALPITAMRDHRERRYAAGMLELVHRSNIRQKIELLLNQRLGFTLTSAEKKKVKFLFDCRNEILHSTPRYKEYPASEPHTAGLPPETIKECDGILAVIVRSSRKSSSLDDARTCYDTATLLAGRLRQL